MARVSSQFEHPQGVTSFLLMYGQPLHAGVQYLKAVARKHHALLYIGRTPVRERSPLLDRKSNSISELGRAFSVFTRTHLCVHKVYNIKRLRNGFSSTLSIVKHTFNINNNNRRRRLV